MSGCSHLTCEAAEFPQKIVFAGLSVNLVHVITKGESTVFPCTKVLYLEPCALAVRLFGCLLAAGAQLWKVITSMYAGWHRQAANHRLCSEYLLTCNSGGDDGGVGISLC